MRQESMFSDMTGLDYMSVKRGITSRLEGQVWEI